MGSVDLRSLLKSFGLWPYVRSFLYVSGAPYWIQ